LHYEVFGRGKPVILLHGWLGSWGLWQETMTFLGKNYRTYAIDFWGFGESGKKLDTYQINDFVHLVKQFMDQLGIEKAPLVGHSMGGTVALLFALKNPAKTDKVVIVGSPIVGSSLAPMLKAAGRRTVAFLIFTFLGTFRKLMRHYSKSICSDPRFPMMMDRDLSKTTLEAFLSRIASLRKTDLRPTLSQISVPVLGLFGNHDNIVNPNQSKILAQLVPAAQIRRFETAGHFIMLDEPKEFHIQLKKFLDQENI
jgi:pimeloyl-ACP methyl ester carboxylesterase